MAGNTTIVVSNGSFSESTNTENGVEYVAVVHHEDDYDLASEIKQFISTIANCKLYDEVPTNKSNIFQHLEAVSSKCAHIILVVTKTFSNDKCIQHLRDELLQSTNDKIVIIKDGDLPLNFGIRSFRSIDWQKRDRAEKRIKVYLEKPEISSLVPRNIDRVDNLIVQIGQMNIVNFGETSETPAVGGETGES